MRSVKKKKTESMKNKWKEVSVHGTQTRQSKEDEEGSKEVNKETKDCKTKKIKTERRPLRRPLFLYRGYLFFNPRA